MCPFSSSLHSPATTPCLWYKRSIVDDRLCHYWVPHSRCIDIVSRRIAIPNHRCISMHRGARIPRPRTPLRLCTGGWKKTIIHAWMILWGSSCKLVTTRSIWWWVWQILGSWSYTLFCLCWFQIILRWVQAVGHVDWLENITCWILETSSLLLLCTMKPIP